MALRFCLLAISFIFAGTSGVLAADWQQCRTMRTGDPGWTANMAQNGLTMASMLSQVAMDQTYPPGPLPWPPIGPGGLPRTMDETQPLGAPMGPIAREPREGEVCNPCAYSTPRLPWGAYGDCRFGTRTCQTCRTVTIDRQPHELCEIETESCGECTRTTTW